MYIYYVIMYIHLNYGPSTHGYIFDKCKTQNVSTNNYGISKQVEENESGQYI